MNIVQGIIVIFVHVVSGGAMYRKQGCTAWRREQKKSKKVLAPVKAGNSQQGKGATQHRK
jgi:hypothetical protein